MSIETITGGEKMGKHWLFEPGRRLTEEGRSMLMKLDRLQQDISTMIDEFTRHMAVRPPEGAPAVNVDLYRDDGYLVAEMELPGIDPQNVELKVYEDRMTIKAERIQEKKVESKDYYCSERYFGKIARVISLPVLVDPDGAKASFKNGVLTVRMPEKAEVEEGGKKVKIE